MCTVTGSFTPNHPSPIFTTSDEFLVSRPTDHVANSTEQPDRTLEIDRLTQQLTLIAGVSE
jgi:hypothetical protein